MWRLVEIGALVPRWPCDSARVFVEMDFTGRIHLGYRNDLARMHREMLDDVIDRTENRRLAFLDDDGSLQVLFCETGEN